MKTLFAAKNQNFYGSMALLALRVVMGLAFMFHGWSKIQAPFGWMGPDSSVPGILQALAALSEFGGGLALIVGFLTPLVMLGLIGTMAGAAYLHAIVKGDPFVGFSGSYELALLYLVICLNFLTQGPGGFSLDRILFGRKS